MQHKIRKNPLIVGVVVTTAILLILVNLLPLIYKKSNASDSFLANWNGGSLNAFVGNGSTTASTDSTLPDLVDGGFGGSGQAIQASRGDTLKYATANNLDNNKVEYSMELKNKYQLTGVDQSKFRMSKGPEVSGIAYDQSRQIYYIADSQNQEIIKTNWSGTVWESLFKGMLTTSIRRLVYDQSSEYLYIIDGNCVIKTKEDGSGWTKLCGFSSPRGLAYDSASEYLYVANTDSNNIVKTKITGAGWQTFGGTWGNGVGQFEQPWDIDFDATTGYLYIADGRNSRAVKTKFDGTGWTTLTIVGQTGMWGQLQYDPASDFILVNTSTDSNGGSIYKAKMDGSNIINIGSPGAYSYDFYYDSSLDYLYWYRGSFTRVHSDGSARETNGITSGMGANSISDPYAVWVDNGSVYVTSRVGSIFKSADSGSSFKVIGIAGSGSGKFSFYTWGRSPSLTVDPTTGNIFTLDNGTYNTLIQTNDNLSSWNTLGTGFGLYNPCDVSYDSESKNLYATDGDNNRIMRSQMNGTGRTYWGSAGNGVGQFSNPSGIWYDSTSQYLYIMDKGNNRLVRTKFNDSSDWTTLSNFSSPWGMSYDKNTGYVYIADTGANRIVKTKIDGSGWTVLGGFNSPSDVFYDAASDYIYVADTGNNRIVKTKMDGTGWTNMTLDPRRVLFKTQGDEMRLELDLYSQRLKFWMKKATGGIMLQSQPLNWGVDEWHKPSVYFNRASGKVELKIDDVVVDSAEDPTWTTALPNFGNYIYVSTDPANPDAVNVSPVDDFKVDVQTVDTTDPVNPTTIHAYNDSGKATEFSNEQWGNAANPYFEFAGATDDLSGVLGYWLSFDSDPASDPITQGVYQAHSGVAGAIQTYTSSKTLVSGTTYYLKVRTRDNDYNYSEPSTLFTYKYDGGPPNPPEYINSSPQGCSTASTFTFTWPKVPEEVSGLAGYEYKKGTQGTVTMVPNLNLADETYSFETTPYQEGDNIFYLRAKDNAGNVSTWQTAVICSTGLTYVVDGPHIESGPSSMTVSWTSSKKTTGFVEVRDANSYREPQGHRDFEVSHKITVAGLKSEREYEYRIVWEDENKNDGETEWFKTTTLALPKIIDLKAEVVSPSKVIVSWNTNYPSSAELQWGAAGLDQKVNLDGESNNFYYQLDNLSGGTTYMLSAKCTTSDGADYTAGSTFQTPPLPTITGIKFEPIVDQTTAAMKVTWTTNVEATSSLFCGPKDGAKQEVSLSDRVKDHEMTLSNLNDDTDYEMYASGSDQYGNSVKSDTNTFKTALDTRPAKISAITVETSNVGLDKQDKAQIAVSWKTDEPTTSLVEYGEGISGTDYSNKTTEDKAFTTNHLVIIPELSPNKPYHLRVVSTDKGNNISKSEDHTVIPGDVPKSALQIILQTFTRLFGWLGLR